MSDLIVRVVKIDEIRPHPNADRLEIVKVGGWQIVSGKGNYQAGQLAVHVPPDAMVPEQWARDWEVYDYLSWKKDATKGRVKAVKLRGAPSFGFLAPIPNAVDASVGTDLAEYLGIEKYEPPPPPVGMSAGQMRSEHPLFHRYTDIQNLRNYPDMLAYGEPLVVTEKIHGTNSRVGWVRNNVEGVEMLSFVVGTHKTQRDPKDCGIYGLPFDLYEDALKKLLKWAVGAVPQLNSLIVFGEIYGAGVQDLHYGAKQEKGYRVFDISINGEYLSWNVVEYICQEVGLPTVPILTSGILSYEELLELARGNTTLDDNHIREGIVVRPLVQELTWGRGTLDPSPRRMIFKVISEDYLTRKEGTEYH